MKTAAMILLVGVCTPSLAVATEAGRVAAPRSDLGGDEVTGGQEARGLDAEGGGPVLGVQGTRFTLDGRPTFLLGISYYGGLGASEDSVRRDLDDVETPRLQLAARLGDLVGVRPGRLRGGCRRPARASRSWQAPMAGRRVRPPRPGRGRHAVARQRGGRAGRCRDFEAHRRAVETLVGALKGHRNWYLDLANERDVRDARRVPRRGAEGPAGLARELDPELLVTASYGGHDLDDADLREALLTIGLDFVAPHRPRDAGSPAQTEAKARDCLAPMKELGRPAPVHYQEPFRRDYGRWEPSAADFLEDLSGAMPAGPPAGASTTDGRGPAADRPRRSFDLHARRLFDQLDAEERKVVDRAASQVPGAARSGAGERPGAERPAFGTRRRISAAGHPFP